MLLTNYPGFIHRRFNLIVACDCIWQVRLNGVATFIGIVGLAVALTVLIVLLAR